MTLPFEIGEHVGWRETIPRDKYHLFMTFKQITILLQPFRVQSKYPTENIC